MGGDEVMRRRSISAETMNAVLGGRCELAAIWEGSSRGYKRRLRLRWRLPRAQR